MKRREFLATLTLSGGCINVSDHIQYLSLAIIHL